MSTSHNSPSAPATFGAPRRLALAALAIGVAAPAAAVVLPTLVITSYALVAPDADAVSHFASRIAEPLALVAATAVAALAGRTVAEASRTRATAVRRAILLGAIAALGMLGAAEWVNDVDRWTAVAMVALPLAAGFAGQRVARRKPLVVQLRRRGALGASEALLSLSRQTAQFPTMTITREHATVR